MPGARSTKERSSLRRGKILARRLDGKRKKLMFRSFAELQRAVGKPPTGVYTRGLRKVKYGIMREDFEKGSRWEGFLENQ